MRWSLAALGLIAFGMIEAGETWRAVELPGNSPVVGMGELPFPDGQRAVWASNESGSFRNIDGQWQRWPLIASDDLQTETFSGDGPIIRDLLVAPDENGLTNWWLATSAGLLLTSDGKSWTHLSTSNTALADNDIRVLHLSQSGAGQPEVWVGSQAGLTIWRMGQWEAVLARPDGFQGGVVSAIRGLFHNGQRQTWVAGPAGLSRFQGGRWQRWAADCLRGHRLNAIQTLEYQGEILLLVGTDRALLQLSLDDPEDCRPVLSPMPQTGPVLALARDRHERLYVMMPHRIERFGPAGIANPNDAWTFFDRRDGLSGMTSWQGGHRMDAEGRLWAGSRDGLWTLEAAEAPGPPERRPTLALGHGRSEIAAGADSPLGITAAEPSLTLRHGPAERPHALRFRARLAPDAEFGPWQQDVSLSLAPLALGLHRVEVEVADEYGRVHGPYVFPVRRQWPWPVYAALGGLILLALTVGALMRRRRA